MIASLEGVVASIRADSLVVVVNGVGYRVFVPATSFPVQTGDAVYLDTLMIVREDAITLYGFASEGEREAFEKLISVTGVGPRIALSILSAMSLERLSNAVATGNVDAFGRIPGVGKKTVEKILFELKDKLRGADGLIPVSSMTDTNREVIEALTGFGYTAAEAQAAVRSIPSDVQADDFEARMRHALQYFV